jgi:hypothetical protein
VAPVVEHAAALAGLASINTIPVASKPASKTGTTTFDVTCEERTKLMNTSFYLECLSRLKSWKQAQPAFGQMLAKSKPEYG